MIREDSLLEKRTELPTVLGGAIPTSSLQIPASEFRIDPCALRDVRSFVETHHYSHSLNGVKVSFCFAARHRGELVGAAVFGGMSTTAWRRFGDSEKSVIELRRLVLLDKVARNSESRMIGYMLRWIRRNATYVKRVVSYADPLHGHTGTIYRASNFKYEGVSGRDTGFSDPETGKVYHSRALRTKYKGEYKPFVKKLREKLAKGLLSPIPLPGKHCYTFTLDTERR